MKAFLSNVRALVSRASAGELGLSDFEAQFLALHPDMPLATPDGYAKVVEDLFWVVEDYVADPALRRDSDLADDDLRRAVNAAHIALRA